jgi:NitT/TauT family transport system ATP-binding protein
MNNKATSLASDGTSVIVHRLTKIYNNQPGYPVIMDIDFTIPRGSFAAIVGPSGCGKSTMLRILGGLDCQFDGHVDMLGVSPDILRQHGKIGFMFQDDALLPWRNVRRNIELPLQINRITDSKLVSRAIELVGLQQQVSLRPDQLSGGFRQKVALARALVLSPPILLLDEPLSALDEITRTGITEQLSLVCAEIDTTAILVTHSISEAVFLADFVIVLSSRPAQVARVIPVPKRHPRKLDFLDDKTFMHSVREIRDTLNQTEN